MTNELAHQHDLTRREMMEMLGIAGVGAAAWAGHTHAAGLTETAATFVPGTTVLDSEAATPDEAIVLLEPGIPIDDWMVDPGQSVADHNPAYEPTDSVVIVAFERVLSRKWPEWQSVSAVELFGGVTARSIKFYAFPSARLTQV